MQKRISSLETIEAFLRQKRIAMVGLSRNRKDFSVDLFREFCLRGYEVVPVNPQASEVQGRRCFARVLEIDPPVKAALLMTAPATTERAVKDCLEAGVRVVWVYRAGVLSPETLQLCKERGVQVVAGECPFMFLGSGGVHRWHGRWRKFWGTYPRRGEAVGGI
jgi:uncharacterized protein